MMVSAESFADVSLTEYAIEIFPTFPNFSTTSLIDTNASIKNDRIIQITCFFTSCAYSSDIFVPFLWPKGRIFTFSNIWQSLVGTERVVHCHSIHSGHFFNREHGNLSNQYHRALGLSVKPKTFGKHLLVGRKIPEWKGPNLSLIVFLTIQVRSCD